MYNVSGAFNKQASLGAVVEKASQNRSQSVEKLQITLSVCICTPKSERK